jgi:hypothetical protein
LYFCDAKLLLFHEKTAEKRKKTPLFETFSQKHALLWFIFHIFVRLKIVRYYNVKKIYGKEKRP